MSKLDFNRPKAKNAAPGLSTFTRVVVLIAFYFIGGLLGKEASFMSGKVALVWPPAGISLAAILIFGPKFWPGVALGAFLFAFLNGRPPGFFTFGTAIGNSIGALVCAYLLERFVRFRNTLDRVKDVAGLVGFACLLGTTVNAAFNVVSLSFNGDTPWDSLFESMLDWWVPNAMAVLVVTPFILVWANFSLKNYSLRQGLEAIICVTGLIMGTLVSFNSWYVYGIQSYPFAYLPYPFLVWGALRFGPLGAATGSMLVSTLAIYALLQNRGPFVTVNEKDSLMLIGSYIGILSITNMLLAALASERKTAEDAVRQSERRYRGVVEDQTEIIWRFTCDGLITFVNDAYCRFRGKSRESLIGSHYMPMLSEEDREIPLSFFAKLTPEKPVITYYCKELLPNGQPIWQQCTTRRIFDDSGQTLEYQSVVQDITRRKQIEEAIRHAEERLRVILNSMVDGVIVINAVGDITSFNPAAERIFGRNAYEVLTRPVKELFAPEDRDLYVEYHQQHLKKARPQIIELKALRPDESMIPIDLAITPALIGASTIYVMIVRDISERKKLEDQIRQSQKMEAVGRLAGGIAHDFNNLMQAIIGYTSMLKKRVEEDHPGFDTLLEIERSADRAASLTSQLLTFSRKQVLQPKLLNLNEVFTEMEKLLLRLIGEDIILENQLADNLGWVKADQAQLEQIILNIALNARDAMPQGGRLIVGTMNVELNQRLQGFSQEFIPGQYVILSIRDTGVGMTPEVQAKIFEPFFTTKDVNKGTGLGMSIVYGAVRQNGGEILVESEPGAGTVFQIYFPIVDKPLITSSPETPAPPVSMPATVAHTLSIPSQEKMESILLVEDGDIVRMMLTEILQENGYQVYQAGHGKAALELIRKEKITIDLLITDLIMPEMNGRELRDELVKIFSRVKVIFISGYTDDEVFRQGQLDENANFLQKPFRPDTLLARVREILDQKKQGSNPACIPGNPGV